MTDNIMFTQGNPDDADDGCIIHLHTATPGAHPAPAAFAWAGFIAAGPPGSFVAHIDLETDDPETGQHWREETFGSLGAARMWLFAQALEG